MTSLLAPALLVGGGGLAAYLFLRPKTADAAQLAAGAGTLTGGPLFAASSAGAVAAKPWTLPSAPSPSPGRMIAGPAPSPVDEIARPAVASAPTFVGRWGWPVPRWEGRAPVISDGYGSPRPGMLHAGVDVMFGRIATDPFPVGGVNGSKLFVMPEAWPAVSAADGVLWSAGASPRGYSVVIDHGTVATFYQHLSSLMLPETKPPPKGTLRGQLLPIKAGQPLGVIGGDPLNAPHLKHLHFEVWNGGPSQAFDPAPMMKAWQVFEPRDVVPLFPSARNAARSNDPDFVHVDGYDRRYPGSALEPRPSKGRTPR